MEQERGSGEGIPADGTSLVRTLQSRDLIPPGKKEVWIMHGEARYCLRVTKSGKLILTK